MAARSPENEAGGEVCRGEGGDAGEQQPAGDVVQRGGGDGDDADRLAGQAEFAQDAAEDGHGGDRDGDAAEQAVDERVDAGRQGGSGEAARSEAERQRHRHRHDGDGQGGRARATGAKLAEREIGADLEHQQDQAELADDADRRAGGPAEDGCRRRRKYMAEDRWAERQAREDFADGSRLAERAGQAAEQTAGADHDDELDQDREEQRFRRVSRGSQKPSREMMSRAIAGTGRRSASIVAKTVARHCNLR